MPRGGHNIKDPEDRVNRRTASKERARGTQQRTVETEKGAQPALPGEYEDYPERTHEWWAMWGRSPLTSEFTDEDWSELLDTAELHALVWTPGMRGTPAWFKAMAQLRQRTANYGATPLDRQRLRIQFVFAEKGEDEAGVGYGKGKSSGETTPTNPSGARARRGAFKVHEGGKADGAK
jgi:hypothetical protein